VIAVPLPSGDQLLLSYRVIENQGDQDGNAGLLSVSGYVFGQVEAERGRNTVKPVHDTDMCNSL